jgi:hypothetical protein
MQAVSDVGGSQTFSSSDLAPQGEERERILEIRKPFHIPYYFNNRGRKPYLMGLTDIQVIRYLFKKFL